MLRRLVCDAPNSLAWEPYEVGRPGPGQALVRSEVGVEKHGTMLAFYKGYANERGRWDSDALMHRPGEGALWDYPIPLGNMQLGTVEEAHAEGQTLRVGERVFFSGGFQPFTLVSEHEVWRLSPEVSWKAALMLDPAEFALGAIRDGGVRLGDRVAVFGMGAIGLAAVQLARAAGTEFVAAIDPMANRREAARRCGADLVIDPSHTDVGLMLREASGNVGVDVAIEFSGSLGALQAAIRGVGYLGTVVCGAFPPPYGPGLDFGGEAHMNRPKIVFSRACSDPNPEHPRWSHRRIREACYSLIARGALDGEPVIGPIVPFESLMDEYARAVEHPEESIKLAVRYPGSGL